MRKSFVIIFVVLMVDQVSKFWVKTNMYLGQDHTVTNWFYIHFTENPGMAFGLEFGGVWGKLALSIFRLAAITGLVFWLRSLYRTKAGNAAIIAISLIFAGAVGNMIDSAFYGLIFSDSLGRVAEFMPAVGYAPFLQGKVVDMLYFPLFSGFLPDWVPFWGGDYFIFFRPIFNIADFAISIGIVLMLIFQKQVFPKG